MEPSVITIPLPEVKFYSIAGTMDTFIGSLEPAKTAYFGGYFRENGADHIIKGQLIDPHGSATIAGSLKSDQLEFTKKYDNGPSVDAQISYKYQKTTSGLWIGTFEFVLGEKKVNGNSTCQINVITLEPAGQQ